VTDEDAKEFCATLRRHFAERLSEWEEGFVASIEGQLGRGRSLTARQQEALDDLMERVARGYGR
jgi:hypothetical protein